MDGGTQGKGKVKSEESNSETKREESNSETKREKGKVKNPIANLLNFNLNRYI